MIFKTTFTAAIFGIALFSTAAFSKDDSRVFLQKATQAELGEINQAQLALKMSANPEILKFTRILLEDQRRLQKQLKILADKKRVELPDEITPKQEAVSYRLSKLTVKDKTFDRKYLKQVLKERENFQRLFKTQAKSGTDADIKDLASKTLPQIISHLKAAELLSAKQEKR